MKKECQCTSCGNMAPCEEAKEGLCLECQQMFKELEDDDDCSDEETN